MYRIKPILAVAPVTQPISTTAEKCLPQNSSAFVGNFPYNSGRIPAFSRKMKKGKQIAKNPQETLDPFSAETHSEESRAKRARDRVQVPGRKKPPRGRPQTIPLGWVTGRAYSARIQLQQVWPKLSGPLLAARTEEEVKSAFEEFAKPYAGDFVPNQVSDVFALIRDPKFPKRKEAQITFLADSLGGRPSLSFRRSRDICEQERAKQRQKSKHKIIRNEFYVECTCGYKGPALNNACRLCSAEIPVSIFGQTGKVPSRPLK